MEEVPAGRVAVAECGSGCNDELKGRYPLALLCLKHANDGNEAEIEQGIDATHTRDHWCKLASLKKVYFFERLPKRGLVKSWEKSFRCIVDEVSFNPFSTIEEHDGAGWD